MAIVSHKKIKQLIAAKKLTDRQFFTSPILRAHFADMAAAQTRRYGHKRRVRVMVEWKPKNDDVAHTEGDLIWINAGNPFVTKVRGREARYDMICGLFAHELGHVHYTDFLIAQTHASRTFANAWYPEPPVTRTRDERMNEADIIDYIASEPKHAQLLVKLKHMLCNVLEDGYVDNKMLNRYPGILGHNLRFARQTQYDDSPTLTVMIEREEEDSGHIWMSFTSLLLSYMLWGELKYGDEPMSDERVQAVFSLLPDLDRALIDDDSRERWSVVNTILVRFWHYAKSFLEWCEKRAKDATASGNSASTEDILSQILSAIAGSSAAASGSTTAVSESGSPTKTGSARKRSATARLAAASSPPENESEESEEAGSESEAKKEDESESGDDDTAGETQSDGDELLDMDAAGDDEQSEGDAGGGGDSKTAQDVSTEELGRLPRVNTTDLFEPTDGDLEFDDEYSGTGYSRSAADIENLLETMQERAVHSELEKERTSELNELANSISYGNIHSGVPMKVHRMPVVDDELKDQYNSIATPLLHISKLLQKSVTQQLKDKRRGGKMTGLLMGRRLDAHALPRNDGRVFYKTALPNETPEIAIGLLLDESGSMGSCHRATYARATAIILYDFCKSLNIPMMVYGHSTGDAHVDLYSYAEFDAIDQNDRYRMMDISARWSNRDGAALRFVAEQLDKRREDVKILILVSDGQPADNGYYGTAAEEDLRGIKHEYQKKGVLLVAAAIGDDRDTIERIYGDSYLDITDLDKLPSALTDVIKRHIKS